MEEGGINLINKNQNIVKDPPLITIITVTYNANACLKNCIQSVASQTYSNIEHIILDGGSDDGTIEILKEFGNKIAYWRSEPDLGIYDAMNKALQYSTGEWILFLGADDILLPDFSKMAPLLKDKNCIYYAESQYNQSIHGGFFNAYRLVNFNICHQNILYPKVVFNYYKYNLNYKVSADHHLNLLCFTDNRLRFEFHPIVVANYAAGGFSSTTSDVQFKLDKDKIIKDNFGTIIYWRYKLRKFRHFIKGRE